MTKMTVTPLGSGRTRIRHDDSGAVVETAVPAALGGPGGGFSSTDLVAAALASCIASSLAPVAEREGLPLAAIEVAVVKRLGQRPRRIARLAVTVGLPPGVSATQRVKLERAAATCPVHRSIAGGIDIEIAFEDG